MVIAWETAQEALGFLIAGAWDYLIKPWEAGEVEAKIAGAESLLNGAKPHLDRPGR